MMVGDGPRPGLMGLGAVCLALLAAAGAACGQVVLRRVDVVLNAAGTPTFDLDVDLNGTVDFSFAAAFVPDPQLTVGFDVIDFPFGGNNGVAIDAPTGDGFPSASFLGVGDTVSNGHTFSSASFDQANLQFFIQGEPNTGNFIGRRGFVGLRFDRPGGVSYGFAELGVNAVDDPAAPFDLTIFSVGYNNLLGAPIEISAVPEPASLTLLGAAGLAWAIRRRTRTR